MRFSNMVFLFLSILIIVPPTFLASEDKHLWVDEAGTIHAEQGTTKITVTSEGSISVNGFSTSCTGEMRRETSPTGDVVKCSGTNIKIFDRSGNTLKIVGGTIIKFQTNTGKSYAQALEAGLSIMKNPN